MNGMSLIKIIVRVLFVDSNNSLYIKLYGFSRFVDPLYAREATS